MKYLVDYLKFTLKPREGAELNFFDVLDLLHMTDDCDKFVSYGSRYHYAQCFVWDDVRIYVACPERMHDMGYMVELSGQGCRFLEHHYEQQYNAVFDWKDFLKSVIFMTEYNIDLNFPRLDLAFDDFDGYLDIDVIIEAVRNREYVSLFRNSVLKHEHFDEMIIPSCDIISSLSGKALGETVYFGKRSSNAFFRFYDKLAERKAKCKDPDYLKSIEDIDHWVRFECEFKNKNANSIINSLVSLDDDEFNIYLSEFINGYLRFIDRDDTNVSRCTVKSWWADFLGTVERSSLTCVGVPKDPVAGAVAWLNHSLAPTLFALLSRMGKDKFIDMIDNDDNVQRLTRKHHDIMSGGISDKVEFTSAELWATYLPDVVALHLREKRAAGEYRVV